MTGVLVRESDTVAAGATLFTISSEQVGDRSAERDSLGTSLSGGQARLANERVKFENQRRADEQERARLGERQRTLRAQLALKEQQLTLTREVLARQTRSFDEGLISWAEVSKPQLDVDCLGVEVEAARVDFARRPHSMRASASRWRRARRRSTSSDRSVEEELARARVRKGLLDREGARDGNALTVSAECAGTITTLRVRNAGTVVAESDVLGEMVCDNETLQAELMVPQRGMALVTAGQAVKLQYDAFPYQRYGVRYATVRWISPTSSGQATPRRSGCSPTWTSSACASAAWRRRSCRGWVAAPLSSPAGARC